MPQVFKIGSYWVYFWANENEPLEPVHVHVAQGAPSANATKIWITRAGKCYLSNNNSQIPPRVLRNIMAVIEARSAEVVAKWTSFFWRSALLLLRFYPIPSPRQKMRAPCATVYAEGAGNRTAQRDIAKDPRRKAGIFSCRCLFGRYSSRTGKSG